MQLPALLKTKEVPVKERLSLGIDIGSAKLKAVKLKITQDNVEVCGFDIRPLQVGLSAALREIKQSQDIESVNIGISGVAAVVRYIPFLRMEKAELDKALKFEAQKHIPFSISEVNLDSYILREDLPDNKMLVLLAAAKKDFVGERIKLIEEAGFKANIIDIDSLALFNAFHYNYAQDESVLKHKAIALLNIGASFSNLDILEGNIPRLNRDIRIAGLNFTQQIADALGVDLNSAENMKISPDNERKEKISRAIEVVLSNLAGEIRTSFDYYETQGASSVTKIYLSGGASLFSGLKDALVNLLGIEVDYWDPFKRINVAPGLDSSRIKLLSGQLGVAVGLALR